MNAELKIKIYLAAAYLFEEGRSHPQIVDILKEYEPDGSVLKLIVDKAMNNEWEELHDETRALFSKGMTYDEVVKAISQKEGDKEIVDWICNDWYKLKTLQMECLVEGVTNRVEGLKWVILSAIAIPIFFWMGSSWLVKGIWILALIGSLVQWVLGIRQKSLSNKLHNLFAADIKGV